MVIAISNSPELTVKYMTPALFTNISTCPNSDIAAFANACTCEQMEIVMVMVEMAMEMVKLVMMMPLVMAL